METTAEKVTCVFCNKEKAFLYCKADSADLCLFCDRQVHAANAVSARHLRSLICDWCSMPDVSVRCSAENLFLCGACNWHIHHRGNVLTRHRDIPVEGVSGCPTATDFTLAWGLEFKDRSPRMPADSILQPNPSCTADTMLQELKNQLLGLQLRDLKDSDGGSCSDDHK